MEKYRFVADGRRSADPELQSYVAEARRPTSANGRRSIPGSPSSTNRGRFAELLRHVRSVIDGQSEA